MQDPTDGGVHCILKFSMDEATQCRYEPDDPRSATPRSLWPKVGQRRGGGQAVRRLVGCTLQAFHLHCSAPPLPLAFPPLPSLQDTPCTAQFAGAMARAARSPLVKQHYPVAAARYLLNAQRAWAYLQTYAPSGVCRGRVAVWGAAALQPAPCPLLSLAHLHAPSPLQPPCPQALSAGTTVSEGPAHAWWGVRCTAPSVSSSRTSTLSLPCPVLPCPADGCMQLMPSGDAVPPGWQRLYNW